MHIVTIPDGISEPIPVYGGVALEGGKRYVCSNAFAGSLMISPWRVVIDGRMWSLRSLLSVTQYYPLFFSAKDVNSHDTLDGVNIWLMRGGGWGDLLMLTPLIRAMKKRWPKIIIHVARGDAYKGVYQGLDIIEEQIPIEMSKLSSAILISFEEWIEGHPDAEKNHVAQHFANKVGIDLDGDHKPDYIVSDEEEAWQLEHYPRSSKKRIGLQYLASGLYRSYPYNDQVIQTLLQKNAEVFIFGEKGQFKLDDECPEDLINLTASDLTFRQSAAIAASCDAIVAPDSALVHLASALEVPYVGLYGPFPANLRGSGKHGKGIQGMAPCSPCFFHASRPDEFPAGMPCQEAGMCVALASITPEQVADTAMDLVSPIITLDLVR